MVLKDTWWSEKVKIVFKEKKILPCIKKKGRNRENFVKYKEIKTKTKLKRENAIYWMERGGNYKLMT